MYQGIRLLTIYLSLPILIFVHFYLNIIAADPGADIGLVYPTSGHTANPPSPHDKWLGTFRLPQSSTMNSDFLSSFQNF